MLFGIASHKNLFSFFNILLQTLSYSRLLKAPESHMYFPRVFRKGGYNYMIGKLLFSIFFYSMVVYIVKGLVLLPQFNTGLLFTGLAGAMCCNATGEENREGKFFRGVELRCIGSVQVNIKNETEWKQ